MLLPETRVLESALAPATSLRHSHQEGGLELIPQSVIVTPARASRRGARPAPSVSHAPAAARTRDARALACARDGGREWRAPRLAGARLADERAAELDSAVAEGE